MIEVATLKTAFLRRPGRLGEGYRWVSVVRESEVPDLHIRPFELTDQLPIATRKRLEGSNSALVAGDLHELECSPS